jgi:phage repressor protein C with HTH and peptisase S24 domain
MGNPMNVQRLRELLENSTAYRGNAKALSLDCGLGETAVRDILEGRSKNPRKQTLALIADRLKINIDELNDSATKTDLPSPIAKAASAPALNRRRRFAGLGETIPVRNIGRNQGDDRMPDVGTTLRPANLEGVRDAYAVYMTGDSMEPRYEQGWLLYINPARPPLKGRDVVVYQGDNISIRRYLGQTESELILEQLNPRREIRIALNSVWEIHLIVGSDQDGG